MIPSQPEIQPNFLIENIGGDPKYRKFYMEGDVNNMFYMRSTDKTIDVKLKLSHENRQREIGLITKSTRTMFMRRERDKHLFRKANAYGFCYYILRYQSSFDWVSLSDEQQDWKIPVKFILENGNRFFFKQRGFELQYFLTLEQLAPFEIKKSEGRRI